MNYTEAQRELLNAAFELGQAQRNMEEAETRFKEALEAVESLEASTPIPHHGEKP